MPSLNEVIVRTIVETVRERIGSREPRLGDHGLDAVADDAILFSELFLTLSATAQKAWVDKMEERWNWKKRGDGERVDWGYVQGFDYSKHLNANRIRIMSREDVMGDQLGRILVEFNPEVWEAYVVWKHYENLYDTAHPRLSDAEVSSIQSS